MKLWVDDLRPAPEGWVWAKDPAEAISALATGEVEEMSLDHDLGGDLTSRPIVLWMCEMDVKYPGQQHWPAVVRVHSMNNVGREWLEGMIARYKPVEPRTCRYCGASIVFRLRGTWDWFADTGSALCASTNSPTWKHYPTHPVEGIDY